MFIRTKILATLGPASGSVEKIRELVAAGADVFRINFSHGSPEQRLEYLSNVRQVESELGHPIAVCADLCGPKIRVGMIAGGGVLLVEGQELVIQREAIEGNATRISTTLAELVDDVEIGDSLLMDDGKLRIEVAEKRGADEVVCRVVVGGVLGSGKGVNLPSTNLKLSALTEKDRQDVEWISDKGFDYVALSFVQRADDIEQLRELLIERGCGAHIIAKLEKPQALARVDEIVAAADGVMVARGDLGVEMDFPQVPVAQKRIARLCQQAGKPCIIATQMLESMIAAPVPTRAEVSDVANAVLDHTDAVMLSGETAVGEYPVEAVRAMSRTVEAIQQYHDEMPGAVLVSDEASPTTAAVAGAVRRVLESEDIAAVAVFTASGATGRMLAKNRLGVPVLAMSADMSAVRRMCLYYGVESQFAEAPEWTNDVLKLAEDFARRVEVADSGDRLVVVTGRPINQTGRTNTLIVHEME